MYNMGFTRGYNYNPPKIKWSYNIFAPIRVTGDFRGPYFAWPAAIPEVMRCTFSSPLLEDGNIPRSPGHLFPAMQGQEPSLVDVAWNVTGRPGKYWKRWKNFPGNLTWLAGKSPFFR